jgi:CheY-like chemotaxis protein
MVRVLVVEDEPLPRWVSRKILEQLGYLVMDAENCARANELLSRIRFDVILMDHRLPDGFGLDVVRQLREQGHRSGVIYLSAQAEQITSEQQRELGLNVVLVKPAGHEELKSACQTILNMDAGAVESSGKPVDEAPSQFGRFRLVSCPSEIGAQDVEALMADAVGKPWVALDLRPTETVRDDAMGALLRLAQRCRQEKGRLCLVGIRADLEKSMRSCGFDKECDMISEVKGLESSGRRLSAACERASLVDTVVVRNRHDPVA